MSRLITLQDWAKEEFGDLAPSERVLKNTRKENDGPTRYKVGRYWMIDRNSRFVGTLAEPQLPINANPKLQRIIADGC
ncbi:excisionase [Escherichia coli]|nr:excisionase [Escherichia coli]